MLVESPCFKWHKHVDDLSKVAEFLGCHMAVHYYVQHRDLYFIATNWRTNHEFRDYILTFPENEHYSTDDLAKDFFDRVKERHAKHFDQWRHKYLHLALGGDALPAQYISSWILGTELPSGQYVSANHKTTIDVQLMGIFLTSGVTPASLKEKSFFKSHEDAISSLSNGARLWDDGGSEAMQKFGIYIKQNWLIVVTNI